MEILDPWFADKLKQRRHERVFTTLETLRNQQQERLKLLELYRLLYSDDDCNGYSEAVTTSARGMRSDRSRFSENLIRSVIDTVCAKIGKNSPLPFVLSPDGDGSFKRKAKGLQAFLRGKYDHLKVSDRLRSMLRDAAITGTGAGKILIDYQNRDLSVERTNVANLFVDPSECQYGQQPKQMFQTMAGNKRLMMALYPKYAQQIKNAAPPSYSTLAYRRPKSSLTEQVEIIEAWKLADQPGESGRHVICCSNTTLVDEEWTEQTFPFVFLHYNEPVNGFWGSGLASMLMEIQYRVNYTLLQIQENIRLCGKPTWLIQQASNIDTSHIRNVIGNMLLYKNTPPQLVNFQTTNPEVFQWLADQRQRAYEIAGISQMSATSQRPDQEISGVALESMNDIESERFIMFGKAYERASLDVADRLLSVTAEEYKKDKTDADEAIMFKSTYSRPNEITTLKWSQVNMQRDQFNLSIFPVSSLPQSISGRQQMIQDYMQQGMMPADVGRELLDFPNYQRWANLQDASKDNIEKLIDEAVFEGKDHVIEKYHNASYGLQYAQNLYNQQQLNGSDEDQLEKLRQMMDQCQELIAASQPSTQPVPAAQPTQPNQGAQAIAQ